MNCGTRLVTVGSELLAGEVTDTNSPYLAKRAFTAGYPVIGIETIPDDVPVIAAAVKRALADPETARIVVSGGVGPTHDDCTLEGVAAGLDRALELNQAVYSKIEASVMRLYTAGRLTRAEVSDDHRRMAMAPAGALVLDNPKGMAAPYAYDVGDKRWLFILPGVPREFITVVDDILMPRFFADGIALHSGELHFEGVPESRLAPALRQVAAEFPDVAIGSYPHVETRELFIRARGSDPERIAAALRRIDELRPQ